MIIIRLRSGLGNQMFQYAFFKQMQFWHGADRVKLDTDTYHWNVHNGLEIDRVFGIDLAPDSVPAEISLRYADVGYRLHHRILRQLRGRRNLAYRNWKDIRYEEYRSMDEVYLEGFWNEERYFHDVAPLIRELYQFPELTDAAGRLLTDRIREVTSVSVHVRRGDYQKYQKTFPMCPPAYYELASAHLQQKYPNLHFFVFSDDLDWCRHNLSLNGPVYFVAQTNPLDAWKDMMLMSRCRHHIIANSTFSWWAAWLNPQENKSVIYPESVFLTYKSMPAGWTRI